MPRTGTRSRIARSYACTTTSQPCMPMAPPITVASEQKATTREPLMVPTAASMPESSSGVISSTEPSSSRAARRWFGLRGSSSRGSFSFFAAGAAGAGAGATVAVMRALLRVSWLLSCTRW